MILQVIKIHDKQLYKKNLIFESQEKNITDSIKGSKELIDNNFFLSNQKKKYVSVPLFSFRFFIGCFFRGTFMAVVVLPEEDIEDDVLALRLDAGVVDDRTGSPTSTKYLT